jgi:hypothetical protein
MKPPQAILQLLARATIAMPAAVVVMILLIASAAGVVMLPIIAIFFFCTGNIREGVLSVMASISSFFVARYLMRKFWEEPPSVL